MKTAVSELDLIEQYAKMHRLPETFRGYSLGPHVATIRRLIDETGAKTLLDYGCGKAWQYHRKRADHELGMMPTLYDPAVKQYSHKPEGKFDGVICTDVLEHIVDPIPFAERVVGFASLFCFFSISTQDRGKTLPNGLPLHISVHPAQWWRASLLHLNEKVRVVLAFDVE